MNPVVVLVLGALLIYLGASGKAETIVKSIKK